MATLATSAASGAIIRHDPDFEPDEQPVRFAYLSPAAHVWCRTIFPGMAQDRGRNETPFEQVEQVLFEFAIGRPMAYGQQYKKLDPLAQHVWEIKTPDVRLIGWFARKSCFIVVRAEMKKQLLQFKLYQPLIQSTVAFRTALDLDPPKEIAGVRHDDVL